MLPRFLLLMICLLASCATQTKAPPFAKRPAVLTSEECDIYVSLLQYQFAHNASATQASAAVYFIEIQEADPSEQLLSRFDRQGIAVEKASDAYFDREFGVHHKGRRAFALLFKAGKIRWIDRNTVEISGGYHEGNLSASGNVYRLRRTHRGWKVTRDEMEWIS